MTMPTPRPFSFSMRKAGGSPGSSTRPPPVFLTSGFRFMFAAFFFFFVAIPLRHIESAARELHVAVHMRRHQEAKSEQDREHRRAAVGNHGQGHSYHRKQSHDHPHINESIGE